MKRKRTKIIRLPISRHIDVNFRNYALYVLENRGIPNWYDSLTNVQRLIMLNSKSTFDKTLSLMGECIKDGYHHGDCLEENSLINLADGSKITIGEWYKNYKNAKLSLSSYDINNKQQINAIGHSPRIGQTTDEIIEIEMENGEILRCSKNHPWYTQRGWVKAEELLETDDILNI